MPRFRITGGASNLPIILALVALLTAAPSWSYDYPIDDPWLATVVGTPEPLQADLPENIGLRIRRLP